MAMRRRNTRMLDVDGVRYRWTVSRAGQATSGRIRVVLETADDPGQRLTVSVACRDAWLDFKDVSEGRRDFDPAAYRPVTPATVRQMVIAGCAAGWRPHEKGKPLDLTWDATTTIEAGKQP